ncbi:HEAT repeat domain-containing protein [Natrarchaeobius sp. A-rgal3]|uniref:HEAT repeat domain-containing protein n=1 Tax=Natrarchaeobius versutus TaxID=1679078 RepID=UPI003510A758
MDDTPDSASIECLPEYVRNGEADRIRERLEHCRDAPVDRRKDAIGAIRSVVDERAGAMAPIVPALATFLTDDDRSVRLRTAKLFVALARVEPDAVVDVVDALASRLADDEEFYYVRARSAEALGYVALERPEEVTMPAILADLRIGLSFDEPEVREKLAKALSHVALGDPDRLRHLVPDLADHLESDDELVRYHLCTAVVAVGCERPDALTDAVDDLSARLEDDSEYVRGRGAEALGLVARSDIAGPELPRERLASLADGDDVESFTRKRARFALAGLEGDSAEAGDESELGSLSAIREHTNEIVEEITAPDGDGCPHCGLTLPGNGPTICPRCGGPY